MKTNRGAAKRFKRSASGGLKGKHGFRNHILTSKSTKRKRQLRDTCRIHKSDERALNRMLPYI